MGNKTKDPPLAAKARDLLVYTRCIAAKRKRRFAMQAGYSRPSAPPWSE